METVYGLVPLRARSTSIPNKEIKLLHGKPLYQYTVDAMLESNIFSEVMISTASKEYAAMVKKKYKNKVSILDRPAKYATHTAPLESVILHYVTSTNIEPDKCIVNVQVTNPFVQAQDYIDGYKKFIDGQYDSLLSAVHAHRFFWNQDDQSINYNYRNRPRRHDWHGNYIENGAFYICYVKGLIKHSNRLHGKIGFHIMNQKSIYEVDDPSDWQIIKNLIKQ